ncbi:hypothetical protein SEA_ZETA1847_62 [Microbacterium phage Zeta1847]|uniref:Uncharacterized protein n=1 Tax=Microbacterium phage Zeta1847 TaxID=2201444 RepID=A0A2Z4Q9E5_9CAUD|nr:hypothetical protein HOT46_gp62 [Microbacterium phage Zeta1847]AWY06696.1 hypothetical protein SEA_ZETA1847_62 [Microbacterium phage Zeta1847]
MSARPAWRPAAERAASLTAPQRAALAAVRARTFDTATELGVSGASLASLERLGLVDVRSTRVQSSNPRARVSTEPIIRRYRITGTGVVVLNALRREEAAS